MPGYRRYRFNTLAVVLGLFMLMLPALASCGSDDSSPTPNAGGNTGAAAGDLQVSLTTNPNPAQAGPVTFTVEVKDANGQPMDGAKVILSAKHPNMTHSGIEGEMAGQGSGRYQASGPFSMMGTWRVTVKVTKEGLPEKTATFDVPVQ